MSQSYLNVGENREETTEGREIFNKLVMRCFFQDFQKDALTKEIIGCKMHDTVHDFVQFLTQNECFTMEATSTRGIETSSANDTTKPRPGDKVRHLTLMFADEDDFPSSIVNCEILRTLATFDSRITSIDSNLIRRLKRLRTLNLSRNLIWKVPEEIGDLMHLRYIDLSRNFVLRELPDSVCNLYSLQTLRLDGCEQLAKLPDNMGKLINLKHLHVDGCRALRYLPKGIGSIRNLRTLDWLHLAHLDDDVVFDQNDSPFIFMKATPSILPPLGKLPSLKVLKLRGIFRLEEIGGEFFGVEETSSSSFPSLETLVLDYLRKFEKWELGRAEAEDSCNSQMKSISIMPRLSSLYIVACHKLKELPDFLLQNAPLQNLLIRSCYSLGSLPDEFISPIPNVSIIGSGVDPFIKGRKIDYDPSED
ncbi:hypothetical protein M0R45_027048 [Rubus argutus]|uniref:Uncharacterized protein n=1 Tax=Rubus argutus TaxID=59490 RepID=A0AAW1WZE7_RUBAR